MSFPNADWLKKALVADPHSIRHERIEDEIVLSAETGELQAFFLKHLHTKDVFNEPSDMKRMRETEQEAKPKQSDGGDEE